MPLRIRRKRSLSATASIPFGVIKGFPYSFTKPSSFATNSRSNGNVLPAIAPEPRGQTLACSITRENLSCGLDQVPQDEQVNDDLP